MIVGRLCYSLDVAVMLLDLIPIKHSSTKIILIIERGACVFWGLSPVPRLVTFTLKICPVWGHDRHTVENVTLHQTTEEGHVLLSFHPHNQNNKQKQRPLHEQGFTFFIFPIKLFCTNTSKVVYVVVIMLPEGSNFVAVTFVIVL